MTRKVAMVGNHTFPIDASIGKQVVDVMLEYGEDVAFLTRGSEGFDQFIIHASLVIGRRVFTYKGQGGTDNLIRDGELVNDADEVLAFFDPETMHREDTGTAMVVEKALTARKPTRAYTVVEGALVWAGETEEGPA